MASGVIIGERVAEILRTEHGFQIAIMAESPAAPVPVRLGRLPIQKGVLV